MLLRDSEGPHISLRIGFHTDGLAIVKTLLRLIVISWDVLKIGVLTVARLKKRMMVVRRLQKGTIEHLIGDSRGLKVYAESEKTLSRIFEGGHTNKPRLSHLLIAGHGEQFARFGLEAFLELSGKMFSNVIWRVERIVDYERGSEL